MTSLENYRRGFQAHHCIAVSKATLFSAQANFRPLKAFFFLFVNRKGIWEERKSSLKKLDFCLLNQSQQNPWKKRRKKTAKQASVWQKNGSPHSQYFKSLESKIMGRYFFQSFFFVIKFQVGLWLLPHQAVQWLTPNDPNKSEGFRL